MTQAAGTPKIQRARGDVLEIHEQALVDDLDELAGISSVEQFHEAELPTLRQTARLLHDHPDTRSGRYAAVRTAISDAIEQIEDAAYADAANALLGYADRWRSVRDRGTDAGRAFTPAVSYDSFRRKSGRNYRVNTLRMVGSAMLANLAVRDEGSEHAGQPGRGHRETAGVGNEEELSGDSAVVDSIEEPLRQTGRYGRQLSARIGALILAIAAVATAVLGVRAIGQDDEPERTEVVRGLPLYRLNLDAGEDSLGHPEGPLRETDGIWRLDLDDGGALVSERPESGFVWMPDIAVNLWESLGGPTGCLGMPTRSPLNRPNRQTEQVFEHASLGIDHETGAISLDPADTCG